MRDPAPPSVDPSESESVLVIDSSESEPDLIISLTPAPAKKKLRCGRCEGPATYYTPQGLTCFEHAWDAAAGQDVDDENFWIPLLLDR